MAARTGEAVVVGAGGMLGRAMAPALRDTGIKAVGAARADIDITDAASVAAGIGEGVRFVVNCAAYTDVDRAESDEAAAMALNAQGPAILAARCAAIGAALVHFSTDYVFDGCADRPYRTTEPRRPLGAYGRSKAAGEERIESSGCEHLIIRTSWLYAPWGKNFARTIAWLAGEKPQLRVVDDQRGRPTSAEGLARTTAALIGRGARGVLHATDGGECSWFEFAQEIVRLTGATCRVEPCTTAEFPRPAPRPAYSVLDLSETESLVGPMTPWKSALADVIERLETT